MDSVSKLEQAMFGDVGGNKKAKANIVDSSVNKNAKLIGKPAGKKNIFQPAMSDNRRRITGE